MPTDDLEYADRDLATAIAQVMYAKAGTAEGQGALTPFAI